MTTVPEKDEPRNRLGAEPNFYCRNNEDLGTSENRPQTSRNGVPREQIPTPPYLRLPSPLRLHCSRSEYGGKTGFVATFVIADAGLSGFMATLSLPVQSI